MELVMCKLFSFPVWLVVSLVWAGAVAYTGFMNAPYVPLDVSANDPGTVEALNRATLRHSILYGLLAAVPPLIVLLFGKLICRGRG